MFGSKLSISKFLKILPAVGELIGEIVSDLEDGKIDATEREHIVNKLIVIVSAVVGL